MSQTYHQRSNAHYTYRSLLGASEAPIALRDELPPTPYEVFDAGVALVTTAEGDEITIRRGAVALFDTNHLGIVAGFLLDTTNGAISHLMLRAKTLDVVSEWTVPVCEITGCEPDKVYLQGF